MSKEDFMFIPKAVAVTALFISLLFTGTASAVQYYPSPNGIQGAIKVVQYRPITDRGLLDQISESTGEYIAKTNYSGLIKDVKTDAR